MFARFRIGDGEQVRLVRPEAVSGVCPQPAIGSNDVDACRLDMSDGGSVTVRGSLAAVEGELLQPSPPAGVDSWPLFGIAAADGQLIDVHTSEDMARDFLADHEGHMEGLEVVRLMARRD